MAADSRYGIEELAQLGGVSRRTVRYYIQEGLIPAPLGAGRGKHYSQEHLERLIAVRNMQEAGRSLDEIRSGAGEVAGGTSEEVPPDPERQMWVRILLAEGLELHISSFWRLPAPGKLSELRSWCQKNIRREGED